MILGVKQVEPTSDSSETMAKGVHAVSAQTIRFFSILNNTKCEFEMKVQISLKNLK